MDEKYNFSDDEQLDLEAEKQREIEAEQYQEKLDETEALLDEKQDLDADWKEFKESIFKKEKQIYKRLEKTTKHRVKQLYKKLWNKTITEQQDFSDICWHNMFGAMLDEKIDDVRISVFGIMDSGSGKSLAVSLNEEILKAVGIKATFLDDLSDVGLLGGVDEHVRKWNIDHNLFNENDSTTTKFGNTYDYTDPRMTGELEDNLWIGFDEGENILKPGQFNLKIQKILRKSLDKKREIIKRLKLERNIIRTNCSFLITTFPLPEIGPTLLTQGLFQRCLVYFKEITDDISRKIEDFIIEDKFGDKERFNPTKDKDFKKLSDNLKQIKKWYDDVRKSSKIIKGSDEIKDFVSKERDIMLTEYQNLNKSDMMILNSILRRGMDIVFRLAYHNAVERMSTKISKDDVKRAMALYRVCFCSVRDFIIGLDESSKLKFFLINLLRNKDMNKTEITQKVCKIFDISVPTALNRLKNLQKEGVFLEKRVGKTMQIGLSKLYK